MRASIVFLNSQENFLELKPFLTLSVGLKSVWGPIAEKMGVDSTEEFASKVTSDHVFKDLDADDLNRFGFSRLQTFYLWMGG